MVGKAVCTVVKNSLSRKFLRREVNLRSVCREKLLALLSQKKCCDNSREWRWAEHGE